MAKAREVVVVVGKGHRDWQEYWNGVDMEEPTTLKVGRGRRLGRWGPCRGMPGGQG
jgi:hypothetical protein